MSHTPGPLVVKETTSKKWDEIGDHAIVDTEGQIVGEAFHRTSHEHTRPARNNAHLWAAAPDMYEALIAGGRYCDALKRYQERGETGFIEGTDELEALFMDWHDKGHAAIAKAEGK